MEFNLEIYSTDIRSTAFNLNKIFSRLGDFFTPILLAKNRALCTLILSIFYLATALLVMNLKETQGVHLSEKVESEPETAKDCKSAGSQKKTADTADNEETEKLNK